MEINFDKFFEYLDEKLEEVKFADPQTDVSHGYNSGAEVMCNYAKCALMMLHTEYVKEKVSA